jgi:lysophospholipase L1-like esterase
MMCFSLFESRPGIGARRIAMALLFIAASQSLAIATTPQAGEEKASSTEDPLVETVLSGTPAGRVELPPGTVVKNLISKGRQLLVVAGADSELLLFQSNPKPHLRLIWTRKIPAGIRSVRIQKDSVWIVTQEAAPHLLELSLKTGKTENTVLLSGPLDTDEEGSKRPGDILDRQLETIPKDNPDPRAPSASAITIARLQTRPASAIVLDNRRPRQLRIFTDFLHQDEGFHFPDVGADNAFGIACIGDSNTFSINNRGWCEQLTSHVADPRLLSLNYASIGGQALGNLPRDGDLQLANALREPSVDLVIASFGINDLRQGATPQELLGKYQSMAAQTRRAGKHFLPTTLAPYRGPLPDTPDLVQEFNQLLRDAFGQDAVIEFFGDLPPEALDSDGVHVTAQGHDLRRAAALPHIYGTVTCKRGTPCTPPRICFHAGNSERIEAIVGEGYPALRGFLPQAACVRPADLKARAAVAAQAAETVWNASLQEKIETDRLKFEEGCLLSRECQTVGNCGAVAMAGSGNAFECRPARNLHCLESLACQNENRCVNWFGECIEEPEEDQVRDDSESREAGAPE